MAAFCLGFAAVGRAMAPPPGWWRQEAEAVLELERGRKQFNENNAFSNIGHSPVFAAFCLFPLLPPPPPPAPIGMGWAGFEVVCASQCSNQLGRFGASGLISAS